MLLRSKSYLGFRFNLSGHLKGTVAAEAGARDEGGGGGGEKEGSGELHGYRLVCFMVCMIETQSRYYENRKVASFFVSPRSVDTTRKTMFAGDDDRISCVTHLIFGYVS